MNVHEISSNILLKESKNQLEASPVYDWSAPQADNYYRRVSLDELREMDPCIPVGIDYKKGEALVSNMAHALTVGYTGSGKDQVIAWNILDVWNKFKSKPSLAIFDYKEEMQRQFAESYRESGYDVYIYDTRHASVSDAYNPFLIIYDSYHAAQRIKEKLDRGASRFGKKFEGVVYKSSAEAYQNAYAKYQEYMDTVYTRTSAFVLKAVIDDPKNMSWILGERALVTGMIMMMLFDSKDPTLTGMTRERFTVKTLSNIMNTIMIDTDTFTEWLKRGKEIFEVQSALSILESHAQATRDSYVTGAMMAIARFANRQISLLTRTEDSIDVKKIANSESPTVIFITCQEDQEIANELCMDFLSDLIEELKTVADKNRSKSLDRDWLFLLNEFGNMPKIPNYQTKITTLRSYRIWMFMEVQSYEQLINIYGKENAATIIGNCDYTFFLGSASYETNKSFSSMMGLRPDVETSASIARGELQIAKRAANIPNVRISDIEELRLGEFFLQTSPKYCKLKSYMTPYFQRPDVTLQLDVTKEYLPFVLSEENYDLEEIVNKKREEERKKREAEEAAEAEERKHREEETQKKAADTIFFDRFREPFGRRNTDAAPRSLSDLFRDADAIDTLDVLDDNVDPSSDISPEIMEKAIKQHREQCSLDLIREIIIDNPTVSRTRCISELKKKIDCVKAVGVAESVLSPFRMAYRRVSKMSNSDFIAFRIRCTS